jgi:VIT1/CCC1 family predicted Fe2+/Mn2+ transporter
MASTHTERRIKRLREMYVDECAGKALFTGLAEHAESGRREVFLTLAASEQRHAEHWKTLLEESGENVKPPRVPFRVRLLVFLARHFGTESVLPLMLKTEANEANRYSHDEEATAAMVAQEAAAGRQIAEMSGIPEGGRIARTEGRHRTDIGGALRATVFGINDGLISNFSLVMGVAAGTNDHSVVVLAGTAGLVAGAFAMSSGEWISVQSQRELYENELRIERGELAAFPDEERAELTAIYKAKGIPDAEARALVENIMSQGDVALDTLAREELGLDPSTLGSPWVAAGSSFGAFAVGALLPLLPFVFASGSGAVVAAILISVLALFAAGAATSVFTGRHAGKAGVRMALIGVSVAAITFGIGKLVGQAV